MKIFRVLVFHAINPNPRPTAQQNEEVKQRNAAPKDRGKFAQAASRPNTLTLADNSQARSLLTVQISGCMPLCVSEPKRKVVFRFEAKHLDPQPTPKELKRDWNATPVDETMIYTPKVPMKWRRVYDGLTAEESATRIYKRFGKGLDVLAD